MGALRRKCFDGTEWSTEMVRQPDTSPQRISVSAPEIYRGYRVYTSQAGCRFAIVPISRPSLEGIVFFSSAEFDWLRAQNLSPEEFKVVWALKRDNHEYSPVPEEVIARAITVAQSTAADIISMLKKPGEEPICEKK
jgi:hypothetical protein